MVLFGIEYNFLNQNTSFVHILQKTVAISKLEAMWSYLHYIQKLHLLGEAKAVFNYVMNTYYKAKQKSTL